MVGVSRFIFNILINVVIRLRSMIWAAPTWTSGARLLSLAWLSASE
jgi:hypothetical protein